MKKKKLTKAEEEQALKNIEQVRKNLEFWMEIGRQRKELNATLLAPSKIEKTVFLIFLLLLLLCLAHQILSLLFPFLNCQ